MQCAVYVSRSCRTRFPRTARIRMLASNTIISVTGSLFCTARLLELRRNLLLVYIGEGGCEAVCRSPQFGHVGRFHGLSWSRDVDPKSLTAPGHGDGRIRL